MMILIVLRFGTSMAVIDEYLIFGGLTATRRPTPGPSSCTTRRSRPACGARLRRRDRHDRRGGDDGLRGDATLRLPAQGLRPMGLQATHPGLAQVRPRESWLVRHRAVIIRHADQLLR